MQPQVIFIAKFNFTLYLIRKTTYITTLITFRYNVRLMDLYICVYLSRNGSNGRGIGFEVWIPFKQAHRGLHLLGLGDVPHGSLQILLLTI